MNRNDSDLDHHDWLNGPYREPNAICPKCWTEFHKDPRDTGNLCDRCAEDEWVSRKEREWREEQVTRGLRRMVNE